MTQPASPESLAAAKAWLEFSNPMGSWQDSDDLETLSALIDKLKVEAREAAFKQLLDETGCICTSSWKIRGRSDPSCHRCDLEQTIIAIKLIENTKPSG